MVQPLCLLLVLHRLHRGQVGHIYVHLPARRRHRLLLYVDDIVLMASTADLLLCTIIILQWEFAMKDLGLFTTSFDLHHHRASA
jgi:hypothetical protein